MFILSSALREGSKVFQSAGAATEKGLSPVVLADLIAGLTNMLLSLHPKLYLK